MDLIEALFEATKNKFENVVFQKTDDSLHLLLKTHNKNVLMYVATYRYSNDCIYTFTTFDKSGRVYLKNDLSDPEFVNNFMNDITERIKYLTAYYI